MYLLFMLDYHLLNHMYFFRQKLMMALQFKQMEITEDQYAVVEETVD